MSENQEEKIYTVNRCFLVLFTKKFEPAINKEPSLLIQWLSNLLYFDFHPATSHHRLYQEISFSMKLLPF